MFKAPHDGAFFVSLTCCKTIRDWDKEATESIACFFLPF